MPKTIICLGAGRGQLPFVKTAAKKYKVIAIDRNPEAQGFAFASEKIVKSTRDAVGIIKELEKLRKKYQLVGLSARTSGFALKTAARIAKQYKLVGLSPEIVPLATEKSKLKIFCRRHGLRMPGNIRTKRYPEHLTTLKFPLIVKPDFPVVGKKSVKIVYNQTQLAAAFTAAAKASGNHFVEIEEYIEGFDVSCFFTVRKGRVRIIGFCDELVGVTRDDLIKGVGVSVPSIIEKTKVKQDIIEIVERFGKLFPCLSAILILSFRVNQDGRPYIIELHSDLGGDLIADVLWPKANTQFNFFQLAVDFAVEGRLRRTALKFKPTTLIYAQPKNKIFQRATVTANLRAAEKFIAKQRLKINPLHKHWLSACKT